MYIKIFVLNSEIPVIHTVSSITLLQSDTENDISFHHPLNVTLM